MNLSRNNDLKPILVYKDPKEAVPFSKIVVPSSMRSPLWKYFGFPANANKEIITKSRIVCGICRAYIAYNKNTTNLSTHLNCKHPEVMEQINNIESKKPDPRQFETPIRLKRSQSPSPSPAKRYKKQQEEEEEEISWYADNDLNWYPENQRKNDSMPSSSGKITAICNAKGKTTIYKPKFQISNEFLVVTSTESNKSLDENIVIESDEHENDNEFIETIDYNNKSDDEQTEIITEDLETVDPNHSKDEFLSEEFLTITETNEVLYKIDEETPKSIVISSKPPPKIANKMITKRSKESQDVTDEMKQIKTFLIKDLVPPNVIDGTGFRDLIAFFAQNADLPSSSEVEKSIEKDYSTQHSRAMSAIKSAVSNRYYLLSLHKLGNSNMVEVSMNTWLNGGSWIGSLDKQIFCVSKDCTNFALSFMDSLHNCSAFIVDFDLQLDEKLNQEIPIIPTFSYVIKMAFDACMDLSAVRKAIKFDKNLLNKINNSYTWLQKFEHLSQSLNESTNAQNTQIIQVLVECLQPLKNCLDVLAFETSTFASIMKPIALQLINQHYTDSEFDSENIVGEGDESDLAVLQKDLKRIIHQVFQQNIIENHFLTMASFFDPRFQRLTTPDDLTLIKDELEKSVQNDEAQKSTDKNQQRQFKVKSDKSTGLSSLFANFSPMSTSKTPKNRFDMEFRSYTQDVSLDMEMCPLEWWSENDSLYPNIKNYVKKYFCVPSFLNNLYRLPLKDQEDLERKYERYANEINDKLLWLHLVELGQKLMES